MDGVIQWRVHVEATTEREETAGQEWKTVGQDENGKAVYGYTPAIRKVVRCNHVVLDQRMDSLDLRALVACINGLQAPNVVWLPPCDPPAAECGPGGAFEGPLDRRHKPASMEVKKAIIEAFGYSLDASGTLYVSDARRPSLSMHFVECRSIRRLCQYLARLMSE